MEHCARYQNIRSEKWVWNKGERRDGLRLVMLKPKRRMPLKISRNQTRRQLELCAIVSLCETTEFTTSASGSGGLLLRRFRAN
jgi:hypothetical protein